MKKILFTLLSISLLFTIASADTTLEGIENFTPVINSGGGGNVVTDYTPVLAISFSHSFTMTPMSMVSDGSYYYGDDGGNFNNCVIETYDFNGTMINSVLTGLDQRGFFYNPNDGLFYIKDYYGPSLFTIDPSNGSNSVVFTGIFNGNQSCLAYDPSTDYMYELDYGTVYQIELSTGNTVNSWGGINGSYAIAFNGTDFFTRNGATVTVYDANFSQLQTFTLPHGGTNNYSLTYANDLLWAGEYGGTWYGYSGCEGGPQADTCFDCNVVIHSQQVPDNGGDIIFDFSVNNCGALALPVYAEMYPTIGDCASGNIFDFNLSKLLVGSLDPGDTFTGYYFYNVGNVSGMGLSGCALNFEVGPAIDDWIANCCDEFTFYSQFGRSGGSTYWGTEWLERGENNVGIPAYTALNQNYPNPFNATTTIPIDLSASGNVSVKVYNLSGQLVETVADGYMDAGQHTLNWDASAVSSGVYFYVLKAGDYVDTRKMNLLK